MFILLAPVGASIVALKGFVQSLKLAGIIDNAALPALINVLTTILWGFGFWILMALVVLLLKNLKTKIPFSLAYWAYIFPVGIFVLATFKVNSSYNFLLLNLFVKSFVWILFVVWVYNILLTLKNVFNKKLLVR